MDFDKNLISYTNGDVSYKVSSDNRIHELTEHYLSIYKL